MSDDRTFRKSWVVYVRWLVGTLVIAAILAAAAVAVGKSDTTSDYAGTARKVILVLALLLAVRRFYLLFLIRAIRWVVKEDGLLVASEILPWRRSMFIFPYETIFEAYYHRTFFGHFLHYGTCTIRRTEGMTTAHRDAYMRGAKELVGLVNARIAQDRAARRPLTAPTVVAAAPHGSSIDQLSELARLRTSGDITIAEYEQMKSRIIGSTPDAPPAAEPL